MFESRFPNVLRDLVENLDVRELLLRDGEPAEPIAFVGPRPKRSIFLFQSSMDAVTAPASGPANL
jgi:hypothetical protein